MDNTVLYQLSYGMYAVGVSDKGMNAGCIINTAVQITADPAVIAISMNKDNYTHQVIEKTKAFSLTILSEDTNPMVISYLGFQSGRDTNKFENVNNTLYHGLPVVADSACGYIACEVIGSMDVGTHTVFTAKVVDGETMSTSKPMTYAYYHRVIKGKAPKHAPTYQKEEPQAGKWVCTVCGYVHDTEPPYDFVCPICKAPKDKFQLME